MNKELLTISEFCTLANTGRTNTYKLINSGQLKAVKLGKRTFIRREDLDSFVKGLQQYPVNAS